MFYTFSAEPCPENSAEFGVFYSIVVMKIKPRYLHTRPTLCEWTIPAHNLMDIF